MYFYIENNESFKTARAISKLLTDVWVLHPFKKYE